MEQNEFVSIITESKSEEREKEREREVESKLENKKALNGFPATAFITFKALE